MYFVKSETWLHRYNALSSTATKSLGPSGVVQAFLENEKDILNTAGPDNKFPGAIWEFQKNVGFNMTNI